MTGGNGHFQNEKIIKRANAPAPMQQAPADATSSEMAMPPYNNPWLEGWMRAMNAASQFWLRPMGLTSLPRPGEVEAEPPRDAQPKPAAPAASGRAHGLELPDAELRDALHARLAELHAFLNDTIAGQFVRRAAMSDELDGLRNELDQALGALDRLRAERDALAAELASRAEAVVSEREALGDRILQLELAVGERDASLEVLRAERDALVVGIDEIRSENARMQDALDEEVRRLRVEIERLQAELTDAVRAVEQAHGRADAGAARIAWLEPAVETMRTELEAAAGEHEATRERLAAVAAALEQARGDADRAAALAPVLEATREELERVAAERETLAARVAALETQLGERVAESERARDAGFGREARVRELESQVTALGGQLERMRMEHEQLAHRAAQIEAERTRAFDDRDAARRKAETAEAQAHALEPALIGLRAELQRVTAEREALVGRVAVLETALVPLPSGSPPAGGSAPRAADAETLSSPDAPAAAGSATRESPEASDQARPGTDAQDDGPRVWPFQLASPAPGGAAAAAGAGTAPVTRLPQRRAAVELHFRKPPGWADTVFVHAWTSSGALSVWPGMRMTAEGGGWYGARIEGVTDVMIVFNDSCGHQTGDLRREVDGWFADGEWRNELPEGVADVVRLADYPVRSEKIGPR